MAELLDRRQESSNAAPTPCKRHREFSLANLRRELSVADSRRVFSAWIDKRRQNLEVDASNLRSNVFDLDLEKRELELQQWESPTTEKQKTAAFVDKVERAHDYFDFIDFLTENYGFKTPWKSDVPIGPVLSQLPDKLNKFNALSYRDISAAVDAHICRRLSGGSSTVPTSISKGEDARHLLSKQLKEEDHYAFSSPTFIAVFLSRKQVYHMDSCPKKELQNIQAFPEYRMDPLTYDEPAAMWSEKTEESVRFVAKKYEEACIKYRELLSRNSRKLKDVRVDGDHLAPVKNLKKGDVRVDGDAGIPLAPVKNLKKGDAGMNLKKGDAGIPLAPVKKLKKGDAGMKLKKGDAGMNLKWRVLLTKLPKNRKPKRKREC